METMTKRIFKLGGLAALLCVLLNCGVDKPVEPGTIRMHLGENPATLNSMISVSAGTNNVTSHMFETLIDQDPDTLEYKPHIAKKWDISADKKVYTFYLRNDVKWQDGHPLTADDIIFTYHKIQDPKVEAAPLRIYYSDVEKVEKVDDYTVRFYFKKVYFRAFLMVGAIPIFPKHILEKYDDFNNNDFNRAPIGNGPYKFVKWDEDQRIVLERWDGYWGKKPKIKRIEFIIIKDDAVAFQALKKGVIDDKGLNSIQWARQTSSQKFNEMFQRLVYPVPNAILYVGWNNQHEIFKDRLVRVAMTHLINRKKIVKKLNFGLGFLATSTMYPFSDQYNKSIEPYPYDVSKALELLAQAGWKDHDGDGILDKNGKKFEFTFTMQSGNPTRESIAIVIKEQLAQVGIIAHIQRYEWAVFLGRIKDKNLDATVLAWTQQFESDPFQIWDMSQADVKGSSNFIGYKNKEASELIRQARVELNPKKRNELYWKFQEILHHDQPYTFLYAPPAIRAVSKRFENVKVHKAGLDMDEWVPRLQQ